MEDIMKALAARLAENKRLQDLQDAGVSNEMVNLIQSDIPDPELKLPTPYGGLQGADLDKYAGENPGPVADIGVNNYNPGPTDIGPNGPSLFDRASQVFKKAEQTGRVVSPPTPAPTPSVIPPAPKAASVKPTQPLSVRPNELEQGYAAGLQDKDLAAAQEEARLQRFMGLLGNAGSAIGAGLSKGNSKDQQIGNPLIEGADIGTKNILQRREAADKEVQRNKSIIELANDKEKNNPSSDVSTIGRAIVKKLASATGMNIGDIENASWSSLEKVVPGLERYASIIESAQARKDLMNDRAAERKATKDVNDDFKNRKQNNLDIRATNSLFSDPNIKREAYKMNSASGAKSIIESIKSGDLKASKNVANQLTNLISSIEMGSPGGQGDREKAGINTLYTKASELASWVAGHPMDTIPKKYLDQLDTEVGALSGRAAKNYKNLTESAISGATLDPENDPGQVAKLAKQRQKKFLEDNGYDPETGELKGNKQLSTEDPRVDAFMKANGISDKNEAIKILKQAGKL